MQIALQKDTVFLDDVRQAAASGKRRLWWLGQSGFLIVAEGRGVLLDPYLSDSLTRKYAKTDKPHTRITERVAAPEALAELGIIEVISSSHNHTDHLDPETLTPFLQTDTRIRLVIPAANREFTLERLGSAFAPQLVELDAGKSVQAGPAWFHGIPAAHNDVERDEAGRCRFLGYVVDHGASTFYHSGDTLLHEQLVPAIRPFSIDTAFLPINGNLPERRVAGNLNGVEAARLAKDIGARLATPCHYDMFEFNTADPGDFKVECARLAQPCRILRNGEGMDF